MRTPAVKRFALLCCALLLLAADPARTDTAQADTSVYALSLAELGALQVQSASKQVEPAAIAPGTIYVVERADIDRYGYRLLQDALESVPSVNLYDPHSWIWGGQRGLVSNFSQTLLLVNGREVNNLIALEGFISRQFGTHNTDRIEVVAGPSSALYGANALAGVINIISREFDREWEGLDAGVELGSFDRRTAHATFGRNYGADTRIAGSLRYFESDEEDYSEFITDRRRFLRGWEDAELAVPYLDAYRNPSRALTWEVQFDHAGFYAGSFGYYNRHSQGLEETTWNYTDNEDHRRLELYYAGVNRSISERLKFKLEYQHIRSFLWGRYFGGLWPVARLEAEDGLEIFEFPAQVTTGSGTVLNGEAEYRDFYPSFAHYLVDQGLLDPAAVSAADIRRYFTHIYSNKNSRGSRRQRVDLQVDWEPDAASSVVAGLSLDFIRYVGLAVTDAATGRGADFDVGLDKSKRADVYDSEKYGAFVQYKRQLLAERLWLTAGVRFDDQNHYGSTLNPRASVVWRAYSGGIVEASYSEAFREPNVFELASGPGIEPAKMQAYEISFQHLFSEGNALALTVYQNDVDDFLGSVSSLIGSGIGSVNAQRVRGLEFQLNGRLSGWDGFVNGAHIFEAEQEISDVAGADARRDVPGISRTRINAGVSRQYRGWELALLYHFRDAYRAFSGSANVPGLFRIPSTHELNLTLNAPAFSFSGAEWKTRLSLLNLTDAENYDANIRQSGTHQFLQDGRSFVVDLMAEF